jgi:hypothetical protein
MTVCLSILILKQKDDLLKQMMSSYPLYHTAYENFELVKEFLDPNFRV